MQANRIVGSATSEAVLEATMVAAGHGRDHHVLALTGSRPRTPDHRRGDRARRPELCTPFALYDGEQLTLDTPSAGLRSYRGLRRSPTPPWCSAAVPRT
ncbi:hypothetical protein QJS66_12160 [Kocuria rhizophila]|nr:hypothetical protein QJS66_12160 [Kocuria rhizophila]